MALRWPFGGRRDGGMSTSFANSTLAELAWQRARTASSRWGWWGALLGAVLALAIYAPAAWLANGVASASGGQLLLADARGSVWSGNAVLLLTGGPGSRDAAALPGRLHWTLRPGWAGADLALRHGCCIDGELRLRLAFGLGRVALRVPARPEALGQWPAAWLTGLGTPWNTVQPGGTARLSSNTGLTLESVQGRWRLTGGAQLELGNLSSRLSPLDSLGRYRLTVRGDAAAGDAATLQLETLDGALQLSGNGQWTGARVRFRGEARAAPGQEVPLQNLLNIIGRRQGAASVITIG